jgi:hypothetical protein
MEQTSTSQSFVIPVRNVDACEHTTQTSITTPDLLMLLTPESQPVDTLLPTPENKISDIDVQKLWSGTNDFVFQVSPITSSKSVRACLEGPATGVYDGEQVLDNKSVVVEVSDNSSVSTQPLVGDNRMLSKPADINLTANWTETDVERSISRPLKLPLKQFTGSDGFYARPLKSNEPSPLDRLEKKIIDSTPSNDADIENQVALYRNKLLRWEAQTNKILDELVTKLEEGIREDKKSVELIVKYMEFNDYKNFSASMKALDLLKVQLLKLGYCFDYIDEIIDNDDVTEDGKKNFTHEFGISVQLK